MRIRIIRKPTLSCIDGVRLDNFQPGTQYEVGNTLGAVFLAEGWAEPVASDEPAVVIPISELAADAPEPPSNLVREAFPPYYDGPPALALDRRRRPRRSR